MNWLEDWDIKIGANYPKRGLYYEKTNFFNK